MGCGTSKPKEKKPQEKEPEIAEFLGENEQKNIPEKEGFSNEIEEASGAPSHEVTDTQDDESVSASQAEELSSSSSSSETNTAGTQTKQKTVNVTKKKESPVTQAPTQPIDRIRQEALVAHNKYREMHGSPPIQLNTELNKMAEKWAEHLAVTTSFEHSPKDKREGTGENLAAHTEIIRQEITDMWYNEIEDYDFSQPGFKPGTGHFTQVIWQDTTQMGLGMSSHSALDGMYRYVANYRPSGNWKGEFQNNVLPRRSNH
ncbi:Golgi-associated plant pathoproteinsis- protein 1 [Bulinus truncatus]|nr:Golgi-associated plant pathoproteinsis- protein 1 [Bulinus truncatus]